MIATPSNCVIIPTADAEKFGVSVSRRFAAGAVAESRTRAAQSPAVPLVINNPGESAVVQPITIGVPLPNGFLHSSDTLWLRDADDCDVPLQTTPLARWPDGTVKWLLVDFVARELPRGVSEWRLCKSATASRLTRPSELRMCACPESFIIDTKVAEFRVGRGVLSSLDRVRVAGQDVLDPAGVRFELTNASGRRETSRVEQVAIESRGPVRATVRLSGSFTGRARCRFVVRLCFFAGTGLVRVRLTIHNPRRARHRGGLWDLGDAGSMRFRDLSIELPLTRSSQPARIGWSTELGRPWNNAVGPVEIYQDSSGGENWRSANHVNRAGRPATSFRGYRERTAGYDVHGLRASPVVGIQTEFAALAAAVPEFWQQFPKAIEVDGSRLRVRLFPEQFGDLFELQGGEQKTHTVWLEFGPSDKSPAGTLSWAHQPARACASADWIVRSGALQDDVPATPNEATPHESLMTSAVAGPNSLFARRETIDEYGWRNFGDLYADHEAAHYAGPPPVISHYNNQYDCVLGLMLQYLRTGDGPWFDLADPLARHVIDVDIYHTDSDRAAYNGGMFWPTDHYRDASTSTHRTYSRANCRRGEPYGGGPSNEHNYTTGLLHYFYLTGDPAARDAVVGLADWVLRMDDGRRTVLGLFDDGPTGLASRTRDDNYHGPGRGAGNSVNATVDGWLVTGERRYIDAAESLIRRVVHPADDVAARDLLNAEARWSYTVFLSVLARYLDVKAEHGDLDSMYAYAQTSLVHYARWMVDHEAPYLDRADTLEYPNETWAAQELRKANVLRLAAGHADEPLASRLWARGDGLADHAWSHLEKFASAATTRVLAITMIEGTRDQLFRTSGVRRMPRPVGHFDFGRPQPFVPQRRRVLNKLKSPRGVVSALARLANPRTWRNVLGRRIRGNE